MSFVYLMDVMKLLVEVLSLTKFQVKFHLMLLGSLVGAGGGTYDVYIGNGSCPVFGCTDSTALTMTH